MRKKIIFLGLVVSIFNLSSCSTILIKSEGPIGSVNYKVTGENRSEKTVEIIPQEKNELSLRFSPVTL